MDIVQARPLYTQKVIAVYDEQVPVYNFLQSLFKTKTTAALDVAVEIRRGENNIAVEVQRGGDSNKNTFNKSSIMPAPIFPIFRSIFLRAVVGGSATKAKS